MGCNHDGGDGFGGTAERIMEMGIGMALAGQMGRMVNETMAHTMQSPPAQAPAPQRLYYAGLEGRQNGG
ncbi:hypothetical protein FACS1894137_09680 [Spirochaetia bacterium]|nr:hypothetical protein FACS1894137_09680 [Spirochaetia bacterium]